MTRGRRFVLPISVALALGTAGVAGVAGSLRQPAAATAAAGITFGTPSVVDPIHTYGEPDILVDPQNSSQVSVSGPTGTGTQRSVWNASVDGGHTYRIVTQGTPPTPLTGLPAPQPGGGDTELQADHTGKQYFADLYALTCLRVATTTDHGATTQQNVYPGGCSGVPGADRQWIRIFDPPGGSAQSAYRGPFPLAYMEYNNLGLSTSGGSSQWTKSTDGLVYTKASLGGEFGADGYPSIDQTTGKVLEAEYDGAGNIKLNIGTPDASGFLTFLDDPPGSSGNLITVATGVNDNSGEAANFVVSSIDSGRNLFVSWVGRSTNPAQRQVFVSVASAASGWKNWSTPVMVSSAPSQVAIFPWVKAGGPGRADVVWYGSNKLVDPSTDAGQAWDVYMAQVTFPTSNSSFNGGSPSSVRQVKATPHPMHYNSACLQGTACIASQGNRNLADYFEVTVDQAGAAEIVYDDTSNGLCQNGFTNFGTGQTVDHCGAPLVSVIRQNGGPGLFGASVSGPSASPTSGQTDVRGDALFPVIGGSNVPGMDIVSNQLRLSGSTLTLTEKVGDLSNPTATMAAIPGTTSLQYVTRWQMGNTIYFAQMERTPDGTQFFAGKAESVDLCSVSACFPHVINYPEPTLANPPGDTHAETGTVSCPATPSPSNPCTLVITIKAADVGAPTASSLLEEVGSYSFASSNRAGAVTNAQAQADQVPLEIDGVCCFNFNASQANGGPESCHENDGDGTSSDGHGGSARFHFDRDACEDHDGESASVNDPGSKTNFNATQIQSVLFDGAAHSVTMTGSGVNNGAPVTFTMTGLDSSAAPPGYFSLTLSDGTAISGSLLSGSIQVQ